MATFEKIATATVGSGGAADITFNTILANWTDLCLKTSLRSGGGNTQWITLSINGTTTGISGRYLYGAGSGSGASGAISAGGLLNPNNPSSWTSGTFTNNEFYIPNYAGSAQKSISIDGVNENNAGAADIMLSAVLWANTAAITSISVYPISGDTFAQHSSATLYGIKKA
jgi:hypothetical protein